MPKVKYSNLSPYAKTPQTVWYLSQYAHRGIPRDGTDREYVIPTKFNKRPDNAAYNLLGSSELWWVFSVLNPNILVDPINDFKAGLTIYIPTKERLTSIL